MKKVYSLEEAEEFFLRNSEGEIICVKDKLEFQVNCYPHAKEFFEK